MNRRDRWWLWRHCRRGSWLFVGMTPDRRPHWTCERGHRRYPTAAQESA